MTSADIRDVLSISNSAPAQKKKKTKPVIDPAIKNATGITRELYSLLGEGTPPIAFIKQDRFKDKPKLNKKAAPWLYKKFSPGGRDKDGLVLRHWVKKGSVEDENGTYHFDQFNIKIDLPTYTSEEYEQYLQGITSDDFVDQDPDWTKEETDYLWSLCADFNLRWIVIADRYQWEGKERTMEDLKDRYYGGVRKLLAGRTPENLMTATQLEQYNSYKWDKAKEIERKAYVENLYKRTPEQIAEENALMAEVKRIEAYDKKARAEREELINLLESPRTMGDTRGYEGSQGMNILFQTLVAADKTRVKQQQRKQSTSQVNVPSGQTATQDTALSARDEVTRRFRRFSPKEEFLFGIAYPEKTTQGAQLRSAKLIISKPTIAQKVSNVFKEIGLSEKLAMPTALVCEKMEKLQAAIQLMLDAKKSVDRADQELRIATARKEVNGLGTRGGSVGAPQLRDKRSASVATEGDGGGDTKRHKKD